MGIDAIIEDAIIFEVIGDIKNISVERKDLRYDCYKAHRDYDLMVNEPTVISEYSEWAKLVDVTNEKYSKYDEKYFEKNWVWIKKINGDGFLKVISFLFPRI